MDSTRALRPVPEGREALMALAVELEVDGEDFGLRTPAEEALWAELEVEFRERIRREGRCWAALGAGS